MIGIAVKGKEGVLLMQAGQDITMTRVTLVELCENVSLDFDCHGVNQFSYRNESLK